MRSMEFFIVFPEGDIQEIPARLRIGELVDINGTPLRLPLGTSKTIAYRVQRISTKEERNSTEILHYLDLVSADELGTYVQR